MSNNKIEISIKDIPEIIETLKNAEKEMKKFQERIDKAIKYIENNSSQSELNIYGIPKCLIFKGSVENLLEILKGEDKE